MNADSLGVMKQYVVHLTNPTSLDERIVVIADEHDLATVAGDAVRQAIGALDGGIDLPMFIDIHAAEHAPVFEPLHSSVAM
jgi:hypothetical protein